MTPVQDSSTSRLPVKKNARNTRASGDFYTFYALLTEEERLLCDRVRAYIDQEVVPVINGYWERAEVPFPLLPKLGELRLAGETIQGYGCLGLKRPAAGLMFAEIARGDAGLATVVGASSLAMYAIHMYGSEEQKQRWLPAMARLEAIGAFATTEPDYGSDIFNLQTQARREGEQWVLNGVKRWVSNASIADVVVVWARTHTGQVNAFLMEKGTPGFDAQVITGKSAVRSSWQTHITLQDVRVPVANRLPLAQNFNDAMKILALGRYKVACSAIGSALACYEHALTYVKKRKQFGKPLAGFQLVQYKLAHMVAEITASQALCYRLGQLMDEDQASAAMISLAKMHTTQKARQIAADARDLLGGNGILLEHHVARHFSDIEAHFTLEGADHLQALTVGLEVTGFQAFF